MDLRGLYPRMIANLFYVVERRFFEMSAWFEASLVDRAKELFARFEASLFDRVKMG